jgi:hypothetical protein
MVTMDITDTMGFTTCTPLPPDLTPPSPWNTPVVDHPLYPDTPLASDPPSPGVMVIMDSMVITDTMATTEPMFPPSMGPESPDTPVVPPHMLPDPVPESARDPPMPNPPSGDLRMVTVDLLDNIAMELEPISLDTLITITMDMDTDTTLARGLLTLSQSSGEPTMATVAGLDKPFPHMVMDTDTFMDTMDTILVNMDTTMDTIMYTTMVNMVNMDNAFHDTKLPPNAI